MDLYTYQWYPLPVAIYPFVLPNREGQFISLLNYCFVEFGSNVHFLSGFSGASLAIDDSSSPSFAIYYMFGMCYFQFRLAYKC
jgi:hypothetical protein